MSKDPEKRTQWHKLLALLLDDFVQGMGYQVDSEVDVSRMSQFLDIVVLRHQETEAAVVWPDGLQGHLLKHNLITFKSYQDSLTEDSNQELLSHGWNYRRLNGTSPDKPLALSECRMIAITARYPQNLSKAMVLEVHSQGVYDVQLGHLEVRVLVLNQLPQQEPNTLLLLFASVQDQVNYAKEHYQLRSNLLSTRLRELFGEYWEGLGMKYTLDDFAREFTQKHLKDLSPEDRLEGLTPEERLKGLPPEELIKALSPEALARLRDMLRQVEDQTS